MSSKFKNHYLGFLSHMTEDGVFCTGVNEDGQDDHEVRQVFTWQMPEDGNVTVPILSQIIMTPDKVECFWGKDGTAPSMVFDRV